MYQNGKAVDIWASINVIQQFSLNSQDSILLLFFFLVFFFFGGGVGGGVLLLYSEYIRQWIYSYWLIIHLMIKVVSHALWLYFKFKMFLQYLYRQGNDSAQQWLGKYGYKTLYWWKKCIPLKSEL